MHKSFRVRVIEELSEMDGLDMFRWGVLIVAGLSLVGWLLFETVTHAAATFGLLLFLTVLILSSIAVGAILKASAKSWLKRSSV
ncbi:hypothetical protein [Agrobacterium sp. NPDC089420]|uniref:hypothetical protein n=1 Tax=Agrobacterium sp. NPDC089420 TaxID=3363918 RepID=UPI00384FE105